MLVGTAPSGGGAATSLSLATTPRVVADVNATWEWAGPWELAPGITQVATAHSMCAIAYVLLRPPGGYDPACPGASHERGMPLVREVLDGSGVGAGDVIEVRRANDGMWLEVQARREFDKPMYIVTPEEALANEKEGTTGTKTASHFHARPGCVPAL
mgnify:CR=1 FL=1